MRNQLGIVLVNLVLQHQNNFIVFRERLSVFFFREHHFHFSVSEVFSIPNDNCYQWLSFTFVIYNWSDQWPLQMNFAAFLQSIITIWAVMYAVSPPKYNYYLSCNVRCRYSAVKWNVSSKVCQWIRELKAKKKKKKIKQKIYKKKKKKKKNEKKI